jgi:tungstate transport system ATP-binding protein
LEIKDLKLVLGGRTILNIPAFSVNREESISIMGPNGAGKSSLLLIMAALQEPTRGTVYYFGREIKDQSVIDVRRRMAVVFQKPMLLSGTVMENVETGLKFRNLSRKERERLVGPWLEKLHIDHLARQRARSLSGGEAQRVALAQALVLEPEVIFLDEPFANLDKGIRQELIDEIGTILRAQRITTVMVTHSRSEAAAITDKIYLLEDGEITETEDL